MQASVIIVMHPADAGAAQEAATVAGGLEYRIAEAGVDPRTVDLCVIILSKTAVGDREFLDYASSIARLCRAVVPVRLDDVKPERSGPDIDKHNCADFSCGPGEERLARWSRLFRSNVALYDDYNALRARSDRWDRSGRGDDFLIQNLPQARDASRLVSRMDTDSFSPSTPVMHDYAARSLTYATAVHRKTIWSNVRVALAVVLVAAFIAGTILFTRWANRRFVASMQSVSRFQTDTAPEFSTFRTIQAAESGVIDDAAALETIRDGLSREWVSANIGVENAGQGDYTGSGWFSDDGRRLYAESSGGVLRIWDVATATPLKAWRVAPGSFDFSVSADGRTAAVSGDDGLALVDLEHGSTRLIDAKTPVQSRVAIAKDAARVMVGEDDHVAVWDASGGMRDSAATGEVLDVKRTDDGLRALVRDGDTVHVVGEDTDATPTDLSLPQGSGEFVYGAIGADGTIAVIDAGNLLVARPDAHGGYTDGLRPTGVVTRDAPIGLAVSADGLVAVSTSQDGVHVFDTDAGLDLGTVCEGVTAVTYPAFSRNGSLACGNGLDLVIQSLDAIAPADEPPANAVVSDTATPNPGGTVSAQVDGTGELTVTTSSGKTSTTIGTRFGSIGTITVIAVTPSGDAVAVGTDSGTVIAWDVDASRKSGSAALTHVRTWTAPDGAAIDRLGWNKDRSRLVAHTTSGWWRPWSLHGTSTFAGATAAASARMPACWPGANMEVFGGSFAKRHGLTQCAVAPAAAATTGMAGTASADGTDGK